MNKNTFTITSITQAVKKEENVNIFLNEQFWININKNELLELQLFKGKNISLEEKELLEKRAKLNKVKEKVINLISIRPRSKYELEQYLINKIKAEKEEAISIIEQLIVDKYQSDEEFADWYVRNRVSFGYHGVNKIRAELLKKRIDKAIIKQVINKYFKDDEENTTGQINKLKEYIKKIEKQIRYKDEYDKRNKIIRRLLSRGYDFETIKKALRDKV